MSHLRVPLPVLGRRLEFAHDLEGDLDVDDGAVRVVQAGHQVPQGALLCKKKIELG